MVCCEVVPPWLLGPLPVLAAPVPSVVMQLDLARCSVLHQPRVVACRAPAPAPTLTTMLLLLPTFHRILWLASQPFTACHNLPSAIILVICSCHPCPRSCSCYSQGVTSQRCGNLSSTPVPCLPALVSRMGRSTANCFLQAPVSPAAVSCHYQAAQSLPCAFASAASAALVAVAAASAVTAVTVQPSQQPQEPPAAGAPWPSTGVLLPASAPSTSLPAVAPVTSASSALLLVTAWPALQRQR